MHEQLNWLNATYYDRDLSLEEALTQINVLINNTTRNLANTNNSNFIRVAFGRSKTHQALDKIRNGINFINQWKITPPIKAKPFNEFIAHIVYPFNYDDMNKLKSININFMQSCAESNSLSVHDYNYYIRDKMPEIAKSPQQLNQVIMDLKNHEKNPSDLAALNSLEIKSYQALFIEECDKALTLITDHEKQITNRATRVFLTLLKNTLLQLKTRATTIQSHQDYVGHLSFLHLQLTQSLDKLTVAQATAKQTSNPFRTLFGLSNTGIYRDDMKKYLTSLHETIEPLADYSLLQNLNIGNYLSGLIQNKQASYIKMRKERDGGFIDTLCRQHSLKEYNLTMAKELSKVQSNDNPISIYDKATLYFLLTRIANHIKQLQNEKTNFLSQYWYGVAFIALGGFSNECAILLLPVLLPVAAIGVAAGIPLTVIQLALLPGKGTMLTNIESLQKNVLAEIHRDAENMSLSHFFSDQSSSASRLCR